jgi:predicted transcriptional regulator
MRQNKTFDKSEAWLIIELDKEGKSASEIANEVGRTTASIRSFLEREYRDQRYTKKFNLDNVDKPVQVKPDTPAPKFTMEAPQKHEERAKELSPREMIKKLYDMGYRIENNQLVCYQKVVVKVNDILNCQ